MTISIDENGRNKIAVVTDFNLRSAQDALDLLSDCRHLHDCDFAVIAKEFIDENFFDLRTGLAGEIMQKFVNYNMSIAIYGDFSVYSSKSLRDFIRESNKGRHILFMPDLENALTALRKI